MFFCSSVFLCFSVRRPEVIDTFLWLAETESGPMKRDLLIGRAVMISCLCFSVWFLFVPSLKLKSRVSKSEKKQIWKFFEEI
jgi:hypothetical protein